MGSYPETGSVLLGSLDATQQHALSKSMPFQNEPLPDPEGNVKPKSGVNDLSGVAEEAMMPAMPKVGQQNNVMLNSKVAPPLEAVCKAHDDIDKMAQMASPLAVAAASPLQPRHPNRDEAPKQANADAQATTNLATPPSAPALASEPEARAQVQPSTATPTTHGLLASPHRPSRTTPNTCLSPPNSAIKSEQQAALTLAWLAEAMALPSPGAPSPAPAGHQDTYPAAAATADATMYYGGAGADTPFAVQQAARPATGTGARGRRASASRAAEDGYDDEDGYLASTMLARQRSRASLDAARAARRAQRAHGAAAAAAAESEQKAAKPRFHGQHSRVGRAMTSIIDYILKNQENFATDTGSGVPERVIRQEFGNNPDTSKALRLLVADRKIVRCGAGGRKDPFSYLLAEGFNPTPLEGPPPFPRKQSNGHTTNNNAQDTAAGLSSPDYQELPEAAAPTAAAAPAAAPPAAAATGLETRTPGAAAAQAAALTSPPHTIATTAAAAALTVPSTVKPAAGAQQLRGAARRKRSQHRLSMVLAEAAGESDTTTTTPTAATAAAGGSGSLGGAVEINSGGKRTRKPSAKMEEAKAAEKAMAMLDRHDNALKRAHNGPVPEAKRHQTMAAAGSIGMDVQQQVPLAAAQMMQASVLAQQLPMIPGGVFLSPTAAAEATLQAGGVVPAAPGLMLVAGPGGRGGTFVNAQAAYLLQLQAQAYWRQQVEAAKGGAGPVPAAAAAVGVAVPPAPESLQLPAIQPLQAEVPGA